MPEPKQYATNAKRQAAYRARAQAARNAQLLAQGLPAVPAIPTLPGHARWDAALQEAGRLLEMVSHEMHAYYEDRLEAWQQSDRGAAFEERMEAIEALHSDLLEQFAS